MPYGVENKDAVEAQIRESMQQVTGDPAWVDTDNDETAILLLEHKMAGRRLGFSELWEKLSKSDKIKDRISEGDNTELNFFSNIVFPLAEASLNERRAELMSILRGQRSPLLEPSILERNIEDPLATARTAEHAFRNVVSKEQVTFREVLEAIAEYSLLEVPTKLRSFVATADGDEAESAPDMIDEEADTEAEDEKPDTDEIAAWAEALETTFAQIQHYKRYIDEESVFRTHQGVKGNEFERVMVVMDDDEAGGFLFSYEQYFGVKELSPASQKKQDAGEETGLDRTRRLFYVTSTRAKQSLAHVIYTSNVAALKENLLSRKFARSDEIIDFQA
jgi:DNA helicase-2/ATP-dependent DNA helicase PcrA